MFHSASEMKNRKDKILDVAISLAEEGGFENVRQRDVAAHAGVALGTLYKSFRSKEDILCAALERETALLEKRLEQKPVRGDSPSERISNFFGAITRGLCRKPKYARAVVRAMASGEPEIAKNVASYHERMNRLTVSALRGEYVAEGSAGATESERTAALMLQQLWFSTLVGWSAGLFTQNDVLDQILRFSEVTLRGLDGARAAAS